jgi:hypothetical protein
LQNGLFAQTRRYAQNFILGISINYMPVVKFFACLDLEQKSSFFKAPSSKTDAGIGLKASWNYNTL